MASQGPGATFESFVGRNRVAGTYREATAPADQHTHSRNHEAGDLLIARERSGSVGSGRSLAASRSSATSSHTRRVECLSHAFAPQLSYGVPRVSPPCALPSRCVKIVSLPLLRRLCIVATLTWFLYDWALTSAEEVRNRSPSSCSPSSTNLKVDYVWVRAIKPVRRRSLLTFQRYGRTWTTVAYAIVRTFPSTVAGPPHCIRPDEDCRPGCTVCWRGRCWRRQHFAARASEHPLCFYSAHAQGSVDANRVPPRPPNCTLQMQTHRDIHGQRRRHSCHVLRP